MSNDGTAALYSIPYTMTMCQLPQPPLPGIQARAYNLGPTKFQFCMNMYHLEPLEIFQYYISQEMHT